MNHHLIRLRLPALIAVAPLLSTSAYSAISGPYVADANTVYLYHLNEAALSTSAVNAGSSGFNAIAFDGNPSSNNATNAQAVTTTVLGAATGYTGFGSAATISAADLGLGVDANASGGFQMGLDGGASPDAIAHSTLGASFTLEALVKFTGTTGNREIFCTDNSLANASRGFQFRVTGTSLTDQKLEFNFIGSNTATSTVAIPSTGINAYAPNTWFHVALSYNATGTLSTFYWTKVDPLNTSANAIGTSATESVTGTITGPLVIGNEARSAGSGLNSAEGLLGSIDEIRISNVVRTASQFIFFNDDTDNDGLSDTWEITYFLDITSQNGSGDPDGDSFTNLQEYTAGTNPANAAFTPNDTDGDGLLDSWEVTNFGNITAQNGTGDPDSDFATNAQEQTAGTSPVNNFVFPDSDSDGMSDGWETAYGLVIGTDDSGEDPDNDTFSNLDEFLAKSNPNDPAWTPQKAKLGHRWNFNGNLIDSVGSSNAVIIDPDSNNAVGGVATQSSTDVLLAGGAQASSDYLNLGANLLSGSKTPVTLEFWATQVSIQNWSRIFDFGSSQSEYFMMAWTTGTNLSSDRVEWRDGVDTLSDNTVQPYSLGVEQHVVVTIQPGLGTNGTTLVTWYAAPASTTLGGSQGSFSTANSMVALNDAVMWLGRSQFGGDSTANARYNEFRIWNGALTFTEREAYHAVGADVLNVADTDNDGMLDAWENSNFGSLSHDGSADGDGDLYTDLDEFNANTNPNVQFSSPDSDLDGIPDGWEVHFFRADLSEDLSTVIAKYAAAGDPDGDGFSNSAEFAAGTDPNNAASNPLDVDADGLIDTWEQNYFSNLTQTASADPDNDGATNLQEQDAGSIPNSLASTPADTDGDGIVDTAEAFKPYMADSTTLHLWHLDEVKAPASDAGSNALPLVSLENAALLWKPSLAGFKTGLDVSAGRNTANGGVLAALPLTGDTLDNATMQYAGADGAFTFEAIVKIGFDPSIVQAAGDASSPMQILSGEGDAGTNRVWQFRITPKGTNNTGTAPTLEFINIHGEVGVQTLTASLPMGADPNAINQGNWYHVAVTYNGTENTADNFKLYWTLLDPSRTAASQLFTGQMTTDLITESPDFVIGNEGRVNGGSNGNLVGLIDEVRISSVARAASGFLFAAAGDSDSDGMQDTWETTYFGSLDQGPADDFDHDGTDNLTEFRLGLVPNDGSSRFAASLSGSTIQWSGVTGSFTVQRSTNLTSWTTLQTVTNANSYTDPNPPAGKAFYKVILNP